MLSNLESRDLSQGTKRPRLMLIYVKVSSQVTASLVGRSRSRLPNGTGREGEAETCRMLRTQVGLRWSLDPGARLAGGFGPPPKPPLGPIPPSTVAHGTTKNELSHLILDPERLKTHLSVHLRCKYFTA